MDDLVHPSVSEEIDNCEADPLTVTLLGPLLMCIVRWGQVCLNRH